MCFKSLKQAWQSLHSDRKAISSHKFGLLGMRFFNRPEKECHKILTIHINGIVKPMHGNGTKPDSVYHNFSRECRRFRVHFAANSERAI